MVKTPLVSLLVLNWNGEEVIEECIDSLMKTSYANFEVIVLDNASNDRSLEILKKYKNIKIIQFSCNYGFARGNNIGFSHCKGKYIVTLNNDIIVDPNWLNQPIDFFEKDENLGIVSCRQMQYDNKKVIDILYLYPTSFLLFDRIGYNKRYELGNSKFSKPGYTIGASGASVIYRKVLLEQLNGFEETFFAYHEESDLHIRAFLAGWKCLYVPSATVYHKGSHSFKKLKKTYFYYHERNRIWFIYRNFPVSEIIKNMPVVLLREIRTFFNIVIRRGFILTYLKARIDGFQGMLQFREIRKWNIEAFYHFRKRSNRLKKEKLIPIN